MPIVTLNRWVLLLGVLAGLLSQQSWVTSVLFAVMLPGILFGPRLNPVVVIGKRLFAARNVAAPREDPRLQRFNNSIAVVLLGLAQVAFVMGFALLGWLLAVMVATAAAVAILGYCLGCFLYFQLKRAHYALTRGS